MGAYRRDAYRMEILLILIILALLWPAALRGCLSEIGIVLAAVVVIGLVVEGCSG